MKIAVIVHRFVRRWGVWRDALVVFTRRCALRKHEGEADRRELLERGLKGISALVLLAVLGRAFSHVRAWRTEREIRAYAPPVAVERSCRSETVDLNRATREELESISGIGPALAREIVQYRQRHGPFLRMEEMLILRGVGLRKLKAFSASLCLDPTGAPSSGGIDGTAHGQ
jgi:competence ComEA-like helix-hairpin-helix protein